jgi:flavin-dependent dehydrogenase
MKMARTINLSIDVDIYEPRTFGGGGPASCNHCGGIISESLVQILAAEGINLPASIIRRGIDSYVVHTDVGEVAISSPAEERRIAALYRAKGPRGVADLARAGFDEFLQDMTVEQGARVLRRLVTDIRRGENKTEVVTNNGQVEPYDLVAVATGVNSNLLSSLGGPSEDTPAPHTTRTYICEFRATEEDITTWLGESMHVFLLPIPRLEFAAIIPKNEFATVVMLGEDLDQELVHTFLRTPAVRRCLPVDHMPCVCSCSPLINTGRHGRPYADRLVFIGDTGTTRLYKDGIGAAFRTSKAAAATAIFQGISAAAFERHYWPTCRSIERDNAIGKWLFAGAGLIKGSKVSRRAIVRMARREQLRPGGARPMSTMLWNMFTGSAPYREILRGAVHPGFVGKLMFNLAAGLRRTPRERAAS